MGVNKYGLIGKGLFPETLPPCFDGSDFKRAIRGIVPLIRDRRLWNRSSEIINYNGTKHNGSRRYFGSVNPIQYFHVCEFIHENWSEIDSVVKASPFVVSRPKPAEDGADRPIIIPSLSNLTTEASKKLSYSPVIVRADISQFFPSIYTHSLSWAAHGRDAAKDDRGVESADRYFNSLDQFIRNCQSGETRGVPVGPDAFRIVAEYLASKMDQEIFTKSEGKIVGAARHVDDYFIGVRDESDARFVLSLLREVLSGYRLQLNDFKTEITSGLVPLNDVWAQKLRHELGGSGFWSSEDMVRSVSVATDVARSIGSDSPVKIFLRRYDDRGGVHHFSPFAQSKGWDTIEPYFQRICFHHTHCLDYVFLIVAKRIARNVEYDKSGWVSVCEELIKQHSSRGHDHEVIWSVWLMLMMKAEFDDSLVELLSRYRSPYVRALVVSAYVDGYIKKRPSIRYGGKISSEGGMWLECLVAAGKGYSNAKIGGGFAEEFKHLATRGLKLIDLEAHLESVRPVISRAISKTRYGYDSDEVDDDDPFDDE